jgi:hypothetical protein
MSRTFEDHAEPHDLAFSWDAGGDAEWLLARLGGLLNHYHREAA